MSAADFRVPASISDIRRMLKYYLPNHFDTSLMTISTTLPRLLRISPPLREMTMALPWTWGIVISQPASGVQLILTSHLTLTLTVPFKNGGMFRRRGKV